MDFDPQSIVIGGVSAFVLLLFLVQTVREALNLAGKYIPSIAAILGVGLMLAVAVLPETVLIAMAQGLALAAAVSLSVRYVKEAPNGKESTTFQGHNAKTQRFSTQGTPTSSAGAERRPTRVRNIGETQPLPDYQEDEWSRNRYG